MASLSPGSVFAGRYEILRCLGQGGMGAVYEVVHRETRRRAALKVLLPVLVSDDDARARFAQEACITAELDSPHLVENFDAGVDGESKCPFIVMELLRGESLGERLSRRERLAAHEAVEVLRQVAVALTATHGRGIIHRDLKPDNIFLTRRDDGSHRVKVLDFGIAKVLEQAGLSRNTVNIGTPLYMAPEQIDGARLSAATDLFALAHIAFELLTGESYWEQEVRAAPSTMVLLRWIDAGMKEAPSVRAQRLGVLVGPAFDAWFFRGTARDPKARYGSAIELVASFALAIGQPPPQFQAPVPPESLRFAASAPNPLIARGPRVTSQEETTRTRPAVSVRRTGEPLTTPVGSVRRSSPVVMGVLLGGGAALLLGLIALAVVLGGDDGKRVGSAQSAAGTGDLATQTASAQQAHATVEPLPTPSSASPLASSIAKSSAKTSKPVKGAPPVTAKPKTSADICRTDPRRCPW